MGKRIISLKPLDDQSGMASILITLITMIVISLIVLGFSQISQREQRAALDSELSSEALYAAESGVNDAQNIIEQSIQAGHPIPSKTSCATSTSDSNYPLNPILNSANNVRYTCLLVDPQPISLDYSPVTDQSKIVQVQAVNSTYDIQQLVISWQDFSVPQPEDFTCGSGNGYKQLPVQSTWGCAAGVLRIDIVPMNNPSSDTVIYLHPQPGSAVSPYSTYNYNTAVSGSIYPTYCYQNNYNSMPNLCNMEITGLDSATTGGYYLRITAKYGDQNVNIAAPVTSSDVTCSSSSCNFYKFVNDQALVDVTGQAQDELKRIQARVPINPLDSNVVPDNAIQSTSGICKQFYVTYDSSNWGEQDVAGCSF